jgi:hypothetical protein
MLFKLFNEVKESVCQKHSPKNDIQSVCGILTTKAWWYNNYAISISMILDNDRTKDDKDDRILRGEHLP